MTSRTRRFPSICSTSPLISGKRKRGTSTRAGLRTSTKERSTSCSRRSRKASPIERPERPTPTNVVNLLEALRRSVEAGGASTSKAKGHAPARRTANEKTEQPKRKKTRRTGELAARKSALDHAEHWS